MEALTEPKLNTTSHKNLKEPANNEVLRHLQKVSVHVLRGQRCSGGMTGNNRMAEFLCWNRSTWTYAGYVYKYGKSSPTL